jgi:hypothetical protein
VNPSAILLIIGAVVGPLCLFAWLPSTRRPHATPAPLPRVRITCPELRIDTVLGSPDANEWAAEIIAKRDPNFLLSWRVEPLLTSPNRKNVYV